MDGILAQICAYLALSATGLDTNACLQALKSGYIQSGTQTTYNQAQSYYTKKGEELIRDNISNGVIYGAIGTYFINDAYIKKEIKLSTKCNMVLCDSINMDVGQTSQSYSLAWKWNF